MKKNDILFILAEILFLAAIAIAGKLLFADLLFIVSAVIALAIVSIVQIVIYRRLQKQNLYLHQISQTQMLNDYNQTEALASLLSIIKLEAPLPPMRGWAISPDFATIISSLVFEGKPKTILEASSGVSTVIAAYCLKKLGSGSVLSLDHDPTYAQKTKGIIAQHKLSDIATVRYSPLKDAVINDEKWLWYDLAFLPEIGPIDLLVIDGPPGSIQNMARYPALPLLFDKLSDNAVILLDDTFRQDEKNIIERWLKEYGCFSCETINTEKGATILRKINKAVN
ncbi:class I SAM-dependent methyltransferase [Patescibacteria group bacterium]|nr:class I SAM-dependent methyltransferase [Patescibacteria group bacterium]MBU1449225.1 class I SAM-dependent methyltransferase [Patescibacteria group bacterium]MBU2594196.1 class I SAM-dependent methyltransferase [Candidatus Edwardsbacteria bacterium]